VRIVLRFRQQRSNHKGDLSWVGVEVLRRQEKGSGGGWGWCGKGWWRVLGGETKIKTAYWEGEVEDWGGF